MNDRNPNLHESESESESDEFSFSVELNSDPTDEVISHGKILPLYPLFNRALLLSDPDPIPNDLRSESASSASSAASIEPAGAQNYCEWAPNRAWKKSGSTGSPSVSGCDPSKRGRMRDAAGGKRSHSDGKEKLGRLNASSGSDSGKSGSGSGNKKEMDLVTAHKLFYGKDRRGDKSGGKRSFLPYKPELVGLFAVARAHHHRPFNS